MKRLKQKEVFKNKILQFRSITENNGGYSIRNNDYSEGLFSQNKDIESNTFNSIEGATALKLDEKLEINEQEQNSIVNNLEQSIPESEIEVDADNIPTGVSMENASYIESNEDSSLSSKDANTSFAPSSFEPYSNTKSYSQNDRVLYNSNFYFAITSNQGQLPSANTYNFWIHVLHGKYANRF